MKEKLNKENISKISNSQCGIYKITNIINNHCYIGQSVDIKRRLSEHLLQRYKATIYYAFDKYGIDNFTFEIIELCPKESLNEREKYWIAFYDSYNNGYNMTQGGEGNFMNGHCRQVVQYDQNGNFIAIYNSILDAERALGINPKASNITGVCKGRNYLDHGFQWRYLEDVEEPTQNIGECPKKAIICSKKQKVAQCDIKSHVIIQIFNSIYEASQVTSTSRSGIQKVLKGTQSTAGGYYWIKI